MNDFLKKNKWLAWLVLLTFLFTNFVPSNLSAGNSMAEAADASGTVLTVGANGDYPTITAAIQKAKDGDTIRLLEDMAESVSVGNKSLVFEIPDGVTWTGKNNTTLTANGGNVTLQGAGTITSVAGYRAIEVKKANLAANGVTLKGSGSNISKEPLESTYDTSNKKRPGVIALVYDGNLTLTDLTVCGADAGTENKYYGAIAAINNKAGTTIHVVSDGVTYKDNKVYTGAGLYVGATAVASVNKDIDVKITDCTFSNNINNVSQGVVYISPGNNTRTNSDLQATVTGCIFENNTGSGLFAQEGEKDSGSITVDNCTFDSNTTALTVKNVKNVIAQGSTFTKSTKGAISVNGGNFTLSGGTVTENEGADTVKVSASSGSAYKTKIENVKIYNNKISGSPAAAVSCQLQDIELDQVTITNNSGGAGAYFSRQTNVFVKNSEISNNTGNNGGGILVDQVSGEARVEKTIISGNSATRGGGIYFNKATRAIVTDSEISNNNATQYGGGICCVATNSLSLTGNTVVKQNIATQQGGGLSLGPVGMLPENFTMTVPKTAGIYANKCTNNPEYDEIYLRVAGAKKSSQYYAKIDLERRLGSMEINGAKLTDLSGNGLAGRTVTDEGNKYEMKLHDKETSYTGSSKAKTGIKEIGYGSAVTLPSMIYLDAGKVHSTLHTEDNAIICTTMEEAYNAAKTENVSVIHICSPYTLKVSDQDYINAAGITWQRCDSNHEGPMFSAKGEVTLDGAHIDGNLVPANSAMIDVGSNGKLEITGDTLIENGNNQNGGHGGAIVVNGGTLNMTGGTVRNNLVALQDRSSGGGAIYVQRGTADFDGGVISGNQSGNYGGAILTNDKAVVNFGSKGGCTTVTDNTSVSEGGGICYATGTTGKIRKAVFTKNKSTFHSQYVSGGAISIQAGATVKMQNVYAADNRYTNESGYQWCGALYTCPTGQTGIFDVNGALFVDTKSRLGTKASAICANNIAGKPFFVSDIAPGGGEITYKNDEGEILPNSKYQYTTGSFVLYEEVDEETKEKAKHEATQDGVLILENVGSGPGCAIANNGMLIIGTATKALKVTKTWPEDTPHPAQILVQLQYKELPDNENTDWKNASIGFRKDATQILNADNDWTYVWSSLGDSYDWRVVEYGVTGFTGTSIGPEKSDAFADIKADKYYSQTIANKPAPTMGSLTISKQVYADEAYDVDKEYTFQVELTLPKEAEQTDTLLCYTDLEGKLQPISDPKNFTVTMPADKSITVEGLPVGTTYAVTELFAEGGKAYLVYADGQLISLDKDGKDQYAQVTGTISASETDGNASANVTVVCQNVQPVQLQAQKFWKTPEDVALPVSIKLVLLQNGNDLLTVLVTPDETGMWQTVFDNLPKYDTTGNLYQYTLREEFTDETTGKDYIATYMFKDTGDPCSYALDVTNTYLPQDTVRVTGQKVWQDPTGKKHPTIVIQLLQNDVVYRSVNLKDGETEFSFDDLPKADANGMLYTYTVQEVDVLGYISTVTGDAATGFTITNRLYQGGVGQFSVTKQVHGDTAPVATTPYQFLLQLRATEDATATDAKLAQQRETLKDAYDKACAKQETAKTNTQTKETLFGKAMYYTTASEYQFFMILGGEDENKQEIIYAADRTSPSAYIYSFEETTRAEYSASADESIIQKIVGAIGKLSQEFSSLHHPQAFLERLTEEASNTSGSAISFGMTELGELLQAYADQETAKNLVDTTKQALDDFEKNQGTKPVAVTLIIMDAEGNTKRIALDPDNLDIYNEETQCYNIPVELFADKQYSFSVEATTGTAISYKVLEQGYEMANYDRTTVTTVLDGIAGEAVEQLFSSNDFVALTSGSSYQFIFDNYYKNHEQPKPEEPKPEEPKPDDPDPDDPRPPVTPPSGDDPYDGPYSDNPSTDIPDPDVPLADPDVPEPTNPDIEIDEPDVPLTDVEGEPVGLDEPQVPLGDAPRTGDSNKPISFVGLMLVAVIGLAVTRKRFN